MVGGGGSQSSGNTDDFYAQNTNAVMSIVLFGLIISLVVQVGSPPSPCVASPFLLDIEFLLPSQFLKRLIFNVILRKIKIKLAVTQMSVVHLFQCSFPSPRSLFLSVLARGAMFCLCFLVFSRVRALLVCAYSCILVCSLCACFFLAVR